MQVFAVVGGIAAGKSTVCALMACRYKAVIIDADLLGHQCLQSPAIREQVLERFGGHLLNAQGEINRRKLGKLVFSNVRHRQWLEALVHPEIGRRIRRRLRYRRNTGTRTVLIDAALYFEARLGVEVDAVLAITAPRALRSKRMAARDGLSAAQIATRLDSQPGLRSWTQKADVILDTRGSADQLSARVDVAWRALQRLARRSR